MPPSRNPLQGWRSRNSGGQRKSLNIRDLVINITFWSGIFVTLLVLALNVYLLANKPVDRSQSWAVVYSIFAAIISLAGWIIIKLITDRTGNVRTRWARGFVVLLVATLI